MRKKKPGIRCLPSPSPLSPEDSMDYMESEDYGIGMPQNGKLISPALAVMITKTIKALCEVNVRFDQKLEISGCLHVRSDNQKVLACLIDEEIDKKEEILANQRHEPIVSMLNNTLATALQKAKCPVLAPETEPSLPPLPPPPPQPLQITPQQQESPQVMASLEESIRIAVENSRQAEHAQHRLATVTATNPTPPPLNPVPTPPSVNAIGDHLRSAAENRDAVMATDKNSTSPSESESELAEEQSNLVVNMSITKKEPDFNYNALPPQSTPQAMNPVIPPISIAPQYEKPPPNNNDNKLKQLTIDNIPYETLEVVTAKGGRAKKFQCPFCGIMLSTKGYLKNHINAVHTKTRVYPCDICERLFYSAGALRIHKLRHHWVNSKKHKCHLCKDAFLLPIELRRHLLKKHNISSGVKRSPPTNHDDSSSEHAGDGGGGSGASQEGDNSPPHPYTNDTSTTVADLEAHMKATQMAAQAHIQMVHDMARISQQQAAAQACTEQVMKQGS